MDRREFIKKAAAGLALPYFISSSSLAAKGGVAANDRINLGFIGVGKQAAGTLIGAFLNESDAQIVAICDVDENKKRDTKKRIEDFYAGKADRASFKGCGVYHDFRELLARDDIDAVVIATPDHWHAIPTVEAARAGKDIYCEKPISLTIDEGKKMVEAVRRYDRVFQTGSMQRSWRQFRFAVELVRNGCIGKIHHVDVNVGGPSGVCNLPAEPVPDYLDWDRWLGPAPWRPFNRSLAYSDEQWGWPNFRSYRDFAGGGMTDFGAHHFDIAQWGLGMDGSGPIEVLVPNGKDIKHLTYVYANGVTMSHAPANGIKFFGENGQTVEVDRSFFETNPKSLMSKTFGPEAERVYHSDNHYGDWLGCIRTRSKPICDVEIGYTTAVICHLGNIAYEINRSFKWDPVAQQITNDSDANRMLERSMRSPWQI